MMIYADNAATVKMSQAATDAVLPLLKSGFGNPSASHSEGRAAKAAVETARQEILKLIGAQDGDRLIFTSGGSEANNQALFSVAAQGKKKIIISAIEHPSVFNTAKKLESKGFDIDIIGVEKNGIISPEKIESALTDDVALLSVMFVNNEIGTIQPISDIGKICKANGVVFHCDAVQAAGHIDFDVSELNVDMLSISAHKFGGMKGVGALYIKKETDIKGLISGGEQEYGLRAGTENVIGIVSMAAALKDSLDRLDEKQEKLRMLSKRLIDRLETIPETVLNGSKDKRIAGNVSLSFKNVNSDALLLILDQAGICVSKGSACNAGNEEASRVLKAIGLEPEFALGTVRFSFSCENTQSEIDYIAETVEKAIKILR